MFGFCFAVLLGGTAWITIVAVRLDRNDAAQQRAAELEENVRLALWRMDSALTPLIAQETARAPAHFTTYYPVAGTINRAYLTIQDGQVLAPSPLVAFRSPYVRLHFQVNSDGTLSSPQVPTGEMLDALRAKYGDTVRIEETSRNLERLRLLFRSVSVAESLPSLGDDPLAAVESSTPYFLCSPSMTIQETPPPPDAAGAPLVVSRAGPSKETGRARNDPAQQWLRSSAEQSQRVKQLELSNQLVGESNPGIPLQSRGSARDSAATATVQMPWNHLKVGGFRLIWFGDEMLMMRRVASDNTELIQGCWFDWPEMRQWFLEQVRDLLPAAQLVPVADWSAAQASAQTRFLAVAPLQLIPGQLPQHDTPLASPTWQSLGVAWCCVLVAAAAAALLLRGTLALSQRRADFVSAVTHELRTPLTTFRMYTEMLAGGMIHDEPKRTQYLQTLRRESDRLGHLVENVLSYARLERGRGNGNVESLTVGEILDHIVDRLQERTEQSAIALEINVPASDRAIAINTDATAVGQILFNLVDNACKYAVTAINPRIVVSTDCLNGQVTIRIRDNGAGLSPPAARELFRPFRKSADAAAQTAPGIGLGLALSRRLARSLGGDLALEKHSESGCSFVLSLPR